MKNVYILTEEGRAYSDEGLQYLRALIRDQRKDDSELQFCMGATYNAPSVLAYDLEQHTDSYVVVTRNDGIIVTSGGFAVALRRDLNAAAMAEESTAHRAGFIAKTSWQIACDLLKRGPR